MQESLWNFTLHNPHLCKNPHSLALMFRLPLKLFFGSNLSFREATNQPPESQLLSNVQWGRGIARFYRENESRVADFASTQNLT